jgi:hypothetical protein
MEPTGLGRGRSCFWGTGAATGVNFSSAFTITSESEGTYEKPIFEEEKTLTATFSVSAGRGASKRWLLGRACYLVLKSSYRMSQLRTDEELALNPVAQRAQHQATTEHLWAARRVCC